MLSSKNDNICYCSVFLHTSIDVYSIILSHEQQFRPPSRLYCPYANKKTPFSPSLKSVSSITTPKVIKKNTRKTVSLSLFLKKEKWTSLNRPFVVLTKEIAN